MREEAGRTSMNPHPAEPPRAGRFADGWRDRYEAVASACGFAIFEWDPDSDHIVWGDSLASVLGFPNHSGSDTLARWGTKHLAGSSRQDAISGLREAARAREAIGMTLDVSTPDGSRQSAVLRATPLPFLAEPRFVGILSAGTDARAIIDPSRRAGDGESSTLAIEQVARTIRHEVNNPLAVILGQAQLLREEAAYREDTGLQASLLSILREGERISRTMKKMTQLRSDPSIPGEEDEPTRVGRVARPIIGPAREGLRSSAYRSIVECLPEGVAVCDDKGVIRFVNSALRRITGFSSDVLVGRRIGDVLVSAREGAALIENFGKHLEGVRESYEIRLQRASGDRLWAEVGVASFRGEEGAPWGVLYTFSDITARKRNENALRESALHDALTGLPNRALLMERLAHAVTRARRHTGHRFAVFFLDVDRLKAVNDTIGHAAGDELLITVARRLLTCLRPEDTIARFGGDEFAVLVEGIEDTSSIVGVATRILAELGAPISIDEHRVSTSASLGIAFYDSTASTPEQLLQNADTAMYRAKTAGRGRYEIFDRTMQAEMIARVRDEAELRRALDESQFRLYYQPIVSLASRRMAGVEALLRWEHPSHGFVLPPAFLPLAEETGFILPLGSWVLKQACEQLRGWKDEFGERAPDWICVNISQRQLLQPGFPRAVQEILAASGLDAAALKLDVSETMISDRRALAWGAIRELAALGVKVHVDDFGTGSSPLGDLHQLPLEAMKIDLSFVNRLAQASPPTPAAERSSRVIHTLLSVARGIGVRTIAEGISTLEQLGALREMGCELGQGYLFARPLDDLSIHALIAADDSAAQSGTLDPQE